MKNTICNSFYDTDKQTATEPTPVLLKNLTSKKTVETVPEKTVETIPEKTAVLKKKSTLWIWAASYFAAILISPTENINYKDSGKTNITP